MTYHQEQNQNDQQNPYATYQNTPHQNAQYQNATHQNMPYQNAPYRNTPYQNNQPEEGDRGHDPSQYWHPAPQGKPSGSPNGQDFSHYNAQPPPYDPLKKPPKKRASFWTILFAVLLTASITFAATTAGWYVLFGDRIRQADGVGIQHLPGTTSTDPDKRTGDQLTLTFSEGEGVEEALDKLATIYNLIQDNYYQKKTDTELIEVMMLGLIEQMDSPYTIYMTPESRQEGLDAMSGEYVGIGATVMQQDDGDYVFVDIIPGSPAEEAGLQGGDVIVSVNGEDVSTFEDVNQLAMHVRGEEGTTVTLVLIRALSKEKESVDVVRRPITNASVRWKMVADGIGYIQVTEFSLHASENFERTVMEVMDEGAQHIVIDLRDNSGGYADECVNMLDVLLPPQDVVTIRGREDGKEYEEKWSTTTAALVPDSMTYVILLNEYSASASELFSGVLRDLGKATLVGEQTYGKGVGTLTWDLEDKSAIQITTFEYFLPKGESIHGVGIVPDYEVSLSPEAEAKAISLLTLEEDTQLQKALEILEPRVE